MLAPTQKCTEELRHSGVHIVRSSGEMVNGSLVVVESVAETTQCTQPDINAFVAQALEDAREVLQDLFRSTPEERNHLTQLLRLWRVSTQREDDDERAAQFMIHTEDIRLGTKRLI